MISDDDPPPRGIYYVGKMDQATWGATTAAHRGPSTPGVPGGKPKRAAAAAARRRKLLLRNMAFALAHRHGMSLSHLATAFGMSRVGVQEAIWNVTRRAGPS